MLKRLFDRVCKALQASGRIHQPDKRQHHTGNQTQAKIIRIYPPVKKSTATVIPIN